MVWKKQILFCFLCIACIGVLWLAAIYLTPQVANPATCLCMNCDATGGSCDATCQALGCNVTQISFVECVKVDLNQATVEQLCLLSGVGEEKAKRIIEYRVLVGAFRAVEDVTNVSGITENTVAAWGDQAYVSTVE